MAGPAILKIKIISDAKDAASGLTKAGQTVQKFQAGLSKVAVGAGIVGGGLLAIATAAGKSASELEQARGAVESVFGDQAAQVNAYAESAAGAVGLATSQYSNMSSVLGAQLKNLQIPQEQLVGTTNDLITKASDLAATFGGTTAEAVEALTAAFRGETDPIERYGISIKQADVAAQMAATGTNSLTGAAAKQAQAMAILELINRQSADATGQFAREQDSAAGSAQIAAAQFENARAALGEALLPLMSQVATVAATGAQFVQHHARAFTALGVAVGAIVGVILAAQAASTAYSVVMGIQAAATGANTAALAGNSIALGAYTVAQGVAKAATMAWAGVQWLLNAALTANPIGLVVVAIAALVAAIVLAWRRSETFRTIVIGAWTAIKAASVAVWNFIKQAITVAWRVIVALFQNLHPVGIVLSHWDQIKTATTRTWNAIKNFISRLWQTLVRAHVTAASRIVSALQSGWNRARAATTSAFNSIRSAVTSRISAVLGAVRGIPGRVRAALSGLGSTLYSSGYSLISGFVSGIRGSIGRVTSAARSVVSSARRFFPFSPAQEGPFSGSGYTTTSGRVLVRDFAAAMAAQAGRVRAAALAVTSAGSINPGYTLPGITTPTRRTANPQLHQPINITVNGALDADGVARQIQRIILDLERRRGRQPLGARP